MTRYRATLIRLAISTVLVSIVYFVTYFVWYPKPAFEVVGVSSILCLLVGVDLVLGPLLTLVVYKHGKPGLRFDLAVTVVLEVAALVYGSCRLYEERPHYLVFIVDRVEFVSIKNIDTNEMRYDELRSKPFAKLIKVYARRPADAEGFDRYLSSIMVDGKPDLEGRPEYWEPWSGGSDAIRMQIRPVENLHPKSERERRHVQRAIDLHRDDHPNLGVLPIGGVDDDIGMLVDRDSLEILGVLRADPWNP
jgi:hypothetical protein